SELHESDGWTRLVIEKPFGHDLDSALELNALVHRYFDESQVFRIDHYLGKETVQNLLVFRFANALFESAWHRGQIRRVDIQVHEQVGVETRAGYYDQSGALRDMIQNHLTQLLSLVAVEAPSRFDADAIRQEKIKVLESVIPIRREDVVLGQYTAGRVDGQPVPSYRDEEGVSPSSDTETFVRLQLEIASWRWRGVPFVLETGKRMPEKRTRILIHFHPAPVSIFRPFEDTCDIRPNVLEITLQPDEGFELHFEVKKPRMPLRLATQTLHFQYDEVFGDLPEAYETLLGDVLEGDQTLFVHADEVVNSWKLYTPILEADLPVHPYEPGSDGPRP
ncbi:MAG: glucose-6-phosphate dehydrogenase, partial [Rhodothermales bacterium]